MRLYELLIENDQQLPDDIATGYYDPSEDKINARKPNDTRKKPLFLKQLNRLKRMRALKKHEDLKRQDLLGILYSPIEEVPPGGSPF